MYGGRADKFAARTDFDNEESIRRFRDILKKMGVMHALSRQGAVPGDTVTFMTGDMEY